MRQTVDFGLMRTLLKKQRWERTHALARGNFDLLGMLLRLALVGVFAAAFAVFFGRFTDVYLAIKTDGAADAGERTFELLTFSYALILLLSVAGAVSSIMRELFLADDVKLYAAMPIGARTLYLAKLITIYCNQLLLCTVMALAVNVTVSFHTATAGWFWGMTALTCLLLPLVSIGVGGLLALPIFALRQFLRPRFVLTFVLVTLLTAAGFYLYSLLLGGVKELLLGDDLKYFFSASVMAALGKAARLLYPANLLADVVLGRELLKSGLIILAVLLVSLAVSMAMIRGILTRVLQARIAGAENFVSKKRPLAREKETFGSLLKKEFLQIFRTPSYMFSYFSVAVVMPLMVYFCMSVGSSLLTKLVGLNCNVEIAIFLTLLFGALTNVFCSTNISREGTMFYAVKALPVSWKQVFFCKITFCMMVTAASELISAILLAATGYIGWGVAAFLFVIGMLFGFAQVCFATRYDFNHARFSTEEDGEALESGNTVSAIIVIGMAMSFLVGGTVLLLRMLLALRAVKFAAFGSLTYWLVGGIAVLFAAGAFWYLVHRLGKRYYEFSGGLQ